MKPCIALTGGVLSAVLLGCNGGKPAPATGPTTASPATAAPSTAAAPAPAPAPAPATTPDGSGGDNGGDNGGTKDNGGGGHDHGDAPAVELGVLTIEGHELTVTQWGSIAAGDALAADVTGDIPNGAGLYGWIASADGTPLGAPYNAEKNAESGIWHFHLSQEDDPEADPVWLYLRIRGGGKDARARMLLDGAQEPPPHGGVTAGLLPAGVDEAVDAVGTVEAVWDPTAGGLQLYFYKGKGFGTPMPIDADTGVIALIDDAPVELEVQDAATGSAAKTGIEAIQDPDLTPMVTVTFTSDGKEYTSELLVLEVK